MIIWLASYPKSGNTWVRSIISSLVYSKDGIFNFELLRKIQQFPNKDHFLNLTDKFQDIHELKKFWVLAQEKINLNDKLNFFKTCLLYTSPSPRDATLSRMPSSA